MNIPKAIKILIKLERTLAPIMDASGTDAIKLGIEALKYRRRVKQADPYVTLEPLPGETEE